MFGRSWQIHTMLAFTAFTLLGAEIILLGVCARTYAMTHFGERDGLLESIGRHVRLEHGLVAGVGMLVAGFVIWWRSSSPGHEEDSARSAMSTRPRWRSRSSGSVGSSFRVVLHRADHHALDPGMSSAPPHLRLLLVSANYDPSVGGIEQYTASLGRELARRGHEVTVLCCRESRAPRTELVDGVRVVRTPSTDVLHRRLGVPYPLPSPRRLVRELRTLLAWADVVNVQDAIYATSFPTLLRARRVGVPSVLTQHVGFVPQSRRSLDAVQRAAIATLGRSARLATMRRLRQPCGRRLGANTLGVARVSVIAPGVAAAPRVDRVAVRREFGLPEERFIALFVGRDVPKKGLDIFLGATDPRYELVAVTDRGPASGVQIIPPMSPERLRRLLAAVDAFALPSQAEGFPLTLQEALVTGLPCVVSPGPGYEHFLAADDVLFVPRDAGAMRETLVRLAGDPRLRSELGRRARAVGEREFGLHRFVDAYEELYRGLSASRRPAGR